MIERERTTINIRKDLPDLVRGLGFKNFSRYVEKLVINDVKRLEGVSETVDEDLDKVGEKLKVLSDKWSSLWSERGVFDGKEKAD